jgi:hypothetical protein
MSLLVPPVQKLRCGLRQFRDQDEATQGGPHPPTLPESRDVSPSPLRVLAAAKLTISNEKCSVPGAPKKNRPFQI